MVASADREQRVRDGGERGGEHDGVVDQKVGQVGHAHVRVRQLPHVDREEWQHAREADRVRDERPLCQTG